MSAKRSKSIVKYKTHRKLEISKFYRNFAQLLLFILTLTFASRNFSSKVFCAEEIIVCFMYIRTRLHLAVLFTYIKALCAYLLFQLLSVAKSFNIFPSMRQLWKFCGFTIFFVDLQNFTKIKSFWRQFFVIEHL